MPRVNQIDPKGFGVQEAIILHVGGDKGVAPQGQGIPQQVGASAAPHGHPAHRAAGVHVAHAVGPQRLLDKGSKGGGIHGGAGGTAHPADAVGTPGAIHPVLMELLNLHQSQLLGQGVIDAPRHRVQVGMGADGGDPVLRQRQQNPSVRIAVRHGFGRAEDHRMVGYDQLRPQLGGFLRHLLRDIQGDQNL